MDVKIFLMFIVAENTRSVNIFLYIFISLQNYQLARFKFSSTKSNLQHVHV